MFGRIPVVTYDSTYFMEDRSLTDRTVKDFQITGDSTINKGIKENKTNRVLLLKNKWGNVREKIYLNDRLDAHKIEMFDVTGPLIYRLELIKMQEIKSYRVPYRLKVSNDEGMGFQLDLDRYWADASVSPSVFMLTPPK